MVKYSWSSYICNVFVSAITNDSATSARIWSIHLFHGVLKATLHLRRISIAGVLVDKVNTHWKHHDKRQTLKIFIAYLVKGSKEQSFSSRQSFLRPLNPLLLVQASLDCQFQWEISLQQITWPRLVQSEWFQRQTSMKFWFQFGTEKIHLLAHLCAQLLHYTHSRLWHLSAKNSREFPPTARFCCKNVT